MFSGVDARYRRIQRLPDSSPPDCDPAYAAVPETDAEASGIKIQANPGRDIDVLKNAKFHHTIRYRTFLYKI